jgi:hypothetical protein
MDFESEKMNREEAAPRLNREEAAPRWAALHWEAAVVHPGEVLHLDCRIRDSRPLVDSKMDRAWSAVE